MSAFGLNKAQGAGGKPACSLQYNNKGDITMYDYYIMATYDMGNGKQSDCLVCLAGQTEEQAEQVKAKVIAEMQSGNKQYANIIGNVYIAKDKHEECWWNQGRLD